MTQILFVTFREVLEISLILGILFAYSTNIKSAKKFILFGLGAGIFGSFILALLTDKISALFNGSGQEIFNGAILLFACVMISSTVIWMQKTAKNISGKIKNITKKVEAGEKSLLALFAIALISVLREGFEIVLFTYSYFIAGVSTLEIFVGLLLGIGLGAIFGFALYLGFLKAFGRHFFKVSTWILIFLSCSIAAKSAGYFVAADILPAIKYQIWDSSEIISQKSLIGNILNIFIGYFEKPNLMQLIFYLANLTILLLAIKSLPVKLLKGKVTQKSRTQNS